MGGLSAHMWAIFSHIFALKWPKIRNFCAFSANFAKSFFEGMTDPDAPREGPAAAAPLSYNTN